MTRTTSENGDQERGLSPDDAFANLGNDTRLSILRALWEEYEPFSDSSDVALSFAELQQHVGPVDSGNFNYHLGRLEGHFVHHTDAGYELSDAGRQVVEAVVAGTYTDDPSFEPTELDAPCPDCGGPLEAAYDDGILTVFCPAHDSPIPTPVPSGTMLTTSLPPAGIQHRAPHDAARTALTRTDTKAATMLDGVCPKCAGPVGRSLRVCENHETGDGGVCDMCRSKHAIWIELVCSTCKHELFVPGFFVLFRHPAVVAFFDTHDLTATKPSWELLATFGGFRRRSSRTTRSAFSTPSLSARTNSRSRWTTT